LPATLPLSQEALVPPPEFPMPARLRWIRWAPRAALLAVLLQSLGSCGPARNQFAPPCPQATILGDASDITLYRPSDASGPHRDLTDLALNGRIVWIQGSCKEGDRRNQLAVTASIGIELTRGPAMQGRDAVVPIFVAVVDSGDTILDKRTYLMSANFPPNIDRVTLTPGQANLVLPVTPTKSGAAYTIVAGFQLTPEQLNENLRNRGR
jgi:hypothetical protein